MAARKRLPREATSVRLTPEARQLWALMAAEGGMTQAGWLEMMIRRAARRRKVVLPGEGREPGSAPSAPAWGTKLTDLDPWQEAAAAAKEYYETDPEAIEWAMFAGDMLDETG